MNGALEVRTDRTGSSRDASTGFEGFFAEHRTALFGALWLVTRDRHEADELAQDASLKVWERWERVRGVDGRVGYLYRTAMNLFRTRRRRAGSARRTARRVLLPGDPGRAAPR